MSGFDLSLERRALLRGALASAGGLLLGGLPLGRRALGLEPPEDPRRVLFAYFEGGWDQLLALDPRDPATTDPGIHRIDPAYAATGLGRSIQRVGAMEFGPAVPPAFLRHADRFSIVRGINMDTAAHEVGRRFFLTGRFPRGLAAVGPSTSAVLAAQLGDQSTIPHLAMGVESYAGGLPGFARPLQANTLNDLTFALTPFSEVPPAVLAAVEAFQDAPPSCEAQRLDGEGLATRLRESQRRSRAYLTGELAYLFDLERTDEAMRARIERHRLAGVGDPGDPRALGFAAGQALSSGLAQVAAVRVARNLDTHSAWAANQPPALEDGFRVLAAMLDDLAETPAPDGSGSLLDHTTVLAFSEFGRTPLLNALQGRDHFLGNSCMVAGPSLARGRVIGGSAEVGMMPLDLELDTGRPRPDASDATRASGETVPIGPNHVLATVLDSLGASYADLRVDPIPALRS